jgi:hypothetical protein
LSPLAPFAISAAARRPDRRPDQKVDKDALTLTLEDGKSYKLNAETDLDALKPSGFVIAYDVTNGENIVTDMELPDTE